MEKLVLIKNTKNIHIHKINGKFYVLYDNYCPTGELKCDGCLFYTTSDCEYPQAHDLESIISIIKNHLEK